MHVSAWVSANECDLTCELKLCTGHLSKGLSSMNSFNLHGSVFTVIPGVPMDKQDREAWDLIQGHIAGNSEK